MKKILIIGNLDNTAKNFSEYLSEDYQVQLCTKQLDNIQAMTGILKPDLVILSYLDLEAGDDQPILDWFREKHAKLPVLILLDSKEAQNHKELFENEQFKKMVSPITRAGLINKCHQLLDTAENAPKKSRFDKKKILIVDDTPLMLRNFKSMLDMKYDVLLATSGKQALMTIQQEAPDLVLLDYEMPEMNGREVFETMLADDDMAKIPVVFLTSVSDRKAVCAILQSNPAGYILKPAEKEKLLNTIEEVLDKQ